LISKELNVICGTVIVEIAVKAAAIGTATSQLCNNRAFTNFPTPNGAFLYMKTVSLPRLTVPTTNAPRNGIPNTLNCNSASSGFTTGSDKNMRSMARRTPGCPEIEEDDFAFQFGEGDSLIIKVFREKSGAEIDS
jgi:hypothetical protein